MKAVLYEKPLEFSVKEVENPEIKDQQVLIEVKACGVCKTDVHIHHGEFISGFPLVPGHEFVGEVVKVGAAVKDFKPGDRVAADNTVLCGHCYYCRRNQPLFCENFYSLGCNGSGGFAEYVVVNHDKVFPIGDLSYDEAVMIEPTACAVHGIDVIDVKPGDDILMFGAGPTGIVLAQLLKHAGAANLVVVASDKTKLDLIKKLAADNVIVMDRSDYSKHETEIKSLFPKGFDIIVDATGAKEVIEHCPQFAKYGAKIVIYGVAEENDRISISPYEIFRKELKIIGSFAQTHCFDRAIKFIQNGIVKVKDIVTNRYSISEFDKAISQVETGKGHIKVIIDMQNE
ncbi:zinc-dependent alcohol dehydrogenase family protein [Fodinisporobacter ferrooxydans]|uniref:Zinc-dependent alcohol dehydrogenase family protein n=1 Tax=Fodinisporobacter ferrooxydans TaxID=2901836 RepID=A0ABY4CJ44_9BACL|nr:zinc-dependent alcohol dehydrogenase family protein [Alicyclobacillaceae bacterium MYW30-H2]